MLTNPQVPYDTAPAPHRVRPVLGVQPQLARVGPGHEDLVPELRGGDQAAAGELRTRVNR